MYKVSVITITLNEADSIGKVLAEIPKDVVDEILVVDGHSIDGTADVVKKLGYKVIFQDGKGYGDAFATGVKHTQGEVLILMDGDGSPNPQHIPLLLEKIKAGYDLAWASRYLPSAGSEDDTLIRHIGNKLFTFLVQKIYKMPITDILYMFTAVKREVFEALELNISDFGYCVELPIKAHKAGFKFAEVPSLERKRFSGKSRVNASWDGLKILTTILKG